MLATEGHGDMRKPNSFKHVYHFFPLVRNPFFEMRVRTERYFSPDELQDLLERMRADGADVPMTPAAFKEKYFAYYDDVKDKSLDKQDW